MRPFLLLAAAAAAASLAFPAAAQRAMDEDVKINQLIVYGDEVCPPSTVDEIIVCARKPESERFRIPEDMRESINHPPEKAWGARVEAMEYVGATGIGSCTPVGPGGSIGCLNQLIREARAERAAAGSTNWNRLIEEARQERLGRIDAEAEAVERDLERAD